MSGRGKGGKGLGVFRPEVSQDDAFLILLNMTSKKNKPLLLQHETSLKRSAPKFVYQILYGDRRSVRQDLAQKLSLDTISLHSLAPAQQMYTKAKKLYSLQKESKKHLKAVHREIQQQVAYYPRYGYKYKESQDAFQDKKRRMSL